MTTPGAVYTAAAGGQEVDATPRPLRQCIDCGAALDTSLASNVRVCARDRNRRRALTFLHAALPYARASRLDDFAEAIRTAIKSGALRQ